MVSAAVILAHASASAQDDPPGTEIFFALGLGPGLGWSSAQDIEDGLHFGAQADLLAGIAWLDEWSFAGQFSTWEQTVTGTPFHLHTIGPRIEFAPERREGPFVGGTVGLALTQGDVEEHVGVAGQLFAGYRFPLVHWISLGLEAGAHGHAYEDVGAANPYAAAQLRFHGSVAD